ncbi:MAG TPA: hypothetical protein VI248_26225 [Kineosporiaceae bacterium]
MPDRAGDEHEERYLELRRRVLEVHGEAVRLGAFAAADGEPAPAAEAAGTPAGDTTSVVDDGLPADVEGLDERLLGAVDELIEATDAFLAFEDRLPVLRDVAARAWSVQIVRASAFAMLLGAVLLGLGMWRAILAVFWFPVLLVMLPAAARMAFMPVAPAAGRHRRQRWSALVGGAAALFLAPLAAVFGWLPGVACVAVLGVALTVLFELRGVAR